MLKFLVMVFTTSLTGVVKMLGNISSVTLKSFDANGTELGSEKVIKIRN
jgi:hypothetical protein|tara:strand:- start:1091 stop:1237 length:147 start_codon:yes stop_codon:yes gene_type:complete